LIFSFSQSILVYFTKCKFHNKFHHCFNDFFVWSSLEFTLLMLMLWIFLSFRNWQVFDLWLMFWNALSTHLFMGWICMKHFLWQLKFLWYKYLVWVAMTSAKMKQECYPLKILLQNNSYPQVTWAYVLEKSPLPIANNGKISTLA
jgi:hypothetical protein